MFYGKLQEKQQQKPTANIFFQPIEYFFLL